MLAEQRYREIMGLLSKEGSVKSGTIRQILGVSGETVRRDLETMEAQGLLRRTHGGAISLEQSAESSLYTSFKRRETQNAGMKEEVAQIAARYIREGEAIALDSGTTALALARVIRQKFHNLTVVTNSLAVLQELGTAPGITVVVTGGVYRPDEDAFSSDFATLIFSRLNVDTFFLTTCGISVERGVTYQRMDEIIVQDKMMQAAARTIVIADSSKLGCNSMVKMCDIDRISMIITDSKATPAQIEPFRNANIPVVLPDGASKEQYQL